MSTKPLVLNLTEESSYEGIAIRAGEILEAGGLVVAPTETSYGLLVRADDPDCLTRMLEAKGRPANMATSIFVKDRAHLNLLANTGKYGEILVDKFLPGPLTLVLSDKSSLSAPVVVDGKIGIRWSSFPFIGELVGRLGFPVTATSANVSGRSGERDPDEIGASLGDKVDLIIDAGPAGTDISTVVDCSGDIPRLLRQGAIESMAIENALGVRII